MNAAPASSPQEEDPGEAQITAPTPSGSLRRRVLSAIILGPLMVVAVLAGSPWLDLVVGIAAILMAWEWSIVCNQGVGHGRALVLVGATLAVLVSGSYGITWLALLAALIGTATVGLYTWQRSRRAALSPGQAAVRVAGWSAAGVVWIGAPCFAFLWLRGNEDGMMTALWVLFVVWATDIGGYVFGRTFGGPRLAPAISPSKTWAGLIGGVLCAMVVGAVCALVREPVVADALRLAAFSAVLAIFAQGGDLAESVMKRRFGVKDSGRLIPGHGGMLDRLDGMLAAVAVAALATWILGGSLVSWQ